MAASMADSKIHQCQRLPSDKDRMRMIENVGTQFTLSPSQALGFVKTMVEFGQTVQAASALQQATSNEEEFIHLALSICKFQEDRVAMCAMLDIEYVPLPKKDEPLSTIKRRSVNSGLGQSGSQARPVGF